MIKGLLICVSFLGVFVVTYRLNQIYLRQMTETVTVATARADLLPGESLTAEKLVMAERPAFGMGNDYVSDVNGFLEQGPCYVGDIGIGSGDVIRPSRLTATAGAGGDWRRELTGWEGVRLIAVETNLVRSSGDWLWPGMIVDALVYIPGKDNYEESRPSAVVGPREDPLLKGLLVVDKKNHSGMSMDGQAPAEGYGKDLIPAVVTLMVDEYDIERIKALIRYNEEGVIYFSPTGER